MDALKTLASLGYRRAALILGVLLALLSCASWDKTDHWTTHAPGSCWLLGIGIALVTLSAIAYGYALWQTYAIRRLAAEGAGLDLTKVSETAGVISTHVGSCEVRVTHGRIEDQALEAGTVMVLPCSEYFDDLCVLDTATALGAYAKHVFDGQAPELVTLIRNEARARLGAPTMSQKTGLESAESFGIGRCLLLRSPLNRTVPVALVSTATQRAGQGLSARISYLFDGMRDIAGRLADARLHKITMPILAGGKGGIELPLALVGLLLAVADVVRHSEAGRQLRTVTIVVFKATRDQPDAIDKRVIRRAMALIGSHA